MKLKAKNIKKTCLAIVKKAQNLVLSAKNYGAKNHLAILNLSVSIFILHKLALLDEKILLAFIQIAQGLGQATMINLAIFMKLFGGVES